ncbi:MAG: LptE family protein [Nitrospiraceae bacterium]|nr:LptE family protein [Nitrospiraceae bacterium]
MTFQAFLLKQAASRRRWMHMRFALSLVVGLLAFVPSCGYHFSSVDGVVPQGAKSIAIPVFINGTMEPYVDVEVTKAVVEEFLTDGRLKVVSVENADLVLRGRVTKFEMAPLSYTAASYVQSYNVTIGISLSLVDNKTQKVLLQDVGLGSVFNSIYAVAIGDISQTKIAKDGAMKKACKDLASSLRSRVLDGF